MRSGTQVIVCTITQDKFAAQKYLKRCWPLRIGQSMIFAGLNSYTESNDITTFVKVAHRHRVRLRYHQAIYRDPYFLSGTVSGVSLESTTKTANRLAGSLSLAFSLIL